MTLDTDIGFEKQPKGLDGFLAEKGYKPVSKKRDCTVYESKGSCLTLYYFPAAIKAKDPEEVPNWKASGFKIVSELNINYPREIEAMEAAQRLAAEITQSLDGILYDADTDEFLTKDDI